MEGSWSSGLWTISLTMFCAASLSWSFEFFLIVLLSNANRLSFLLFVQQTAIGKL